MIRNIFKKIFHIFNAIIRRSRWFNDILFQDCRKLIIHSTFNLDVVNLGSTSGVYAFNYEGMNIKAANWALSCNPLVCDEEVLKNYVSYLKPEGTIVILSLCVFSALSGRYDCFEDRYYAILYPSSIPNFSKRKQNEVMARYNRPLLYMPLYNMVKEFWYLLKRPFIKGEKILSEEQLQKDAQRWFDGWLKEFNVNDFSLPLSLVNQDSVLDAAYHLNKIITFCKEHNATPVMVLPPMYHTLAEKFSIKAREILLDSLFAQIDDQSIRFINYMDDSEFSNDRTFFLDSFLLNQIGAKAFTKKVLTDIGIMRN